jgi:DNA invertase Pin-like site-specific DNA recombinase
MTTKEKAIALCRVSTQGQANEGNLVPQQENVQRTADILGVDLMKVWALAVSSRKGKNLKRKDLIEMLEYCKRFKSVKYLIVDEVDRFMRSIEEYAGITEELTRLLLSNEQREKLKQHMRKAWSSYEIERMERARIAFGRVHILKDKKNVAMDSYLAEQDLEMKQDIKNKFEALKQEILEAEKVVTEAQNFEKDFDEFIIYAFDIMDNLGTKWWQQDKATMRVYKQMLFPRGI